MDTLADGERVMALQIEQVTVVAKMRSIPERNGRVVLDFIVTLPRQLLGKSCSVVITPILHKPDESVALEDLVIRGGRFSLLQERDYWQYETYVERFRPDTVGREGLARFVKFPYPEDAHLDSLVEGRECRYVLLFPSGEDRRDLEEDAGNASKGKSWPWTTAPTACRHPIR